MGCAAVRDDARWHQWDGPMRSALKLLKLAAGTFESARVLDELSSVQHSEPSWVSGPTTVSAGCSSLHVQPVPDIHRTKWRRPWREGETCRRARWEKAGLATPRHASTSPTQKDRTPRDPKRRILIDIPCPQQLPQSPAYTTKYFGLVEGALAVMTTTDQLEPRLTTCPMLSSPRSPAHPHPRDEQTPDMNEHKTQHGETEVGRKDEARQHQRRGRRTHGSSTYKNAGESTNSTNKVGSDERVATAEEAPETKPVEGPVPRPWSGSKLATKALCHEENGEHSDSGGECTDIPNKDSPRSCSSAGFKEAWGSKMMMLAVGAHGGEGALSGRELGGDNDGGGNDRVGIVFGDVEQRGSELNGGGEGSSSSSFLSLGLENGSWTTFPGDATDRSLSAAKTADAATTPITKVETKPSSARPSIRARARERMSPKVLARERQMAETEKGTARAPISPHTVIATRVQQLDMDAVMVERHRIDRFEVELPKPHPELYDIWIPQQFFHGKALAPSRDRTPRETGETPSFVTRRSAGTDDGKRAGEAADLIGTRSTPASSSPSPRGVPSPFAAHQHDDIDCTEDPASPPVTGQCRICSPSYLMPPAFNKRPFRESVPVAQATSQITPELSGTPRKHSRAASCGKNHLNEENVDFQLPDKTAELAPSAPLLHLDTALVEDEGWRKIDRLEEECGGGRRGNGCVGGYFDYAKRFSWQTAAEMAEHVAAAAGAEEGDEDIAGFENFSEEQRAIAGERRTMRCWQATQLAVGRLRAPQSVFHPLHRAPSRPEMRRSVTHGRFSPAGRKLWRRSDGLSPRTGQLCLCATQPLSRTACVRAAFTGRTTSDSSGGLPLDASWNWSPEHCGTTDNEEIINSNDSSSSAAGVGGNSRDGGADESSSIMSCPESISDGSQAQARGEDGTSWQENGAAGSLNSIAGDDEVAQVKDADDHVAVKQTLDASREPQQANVMFGEVDGSIRCKVMVAGAEDCVVSSDSNSVASVQQSTRQYSEPDTLVVVARSVKNGLQTEDACEGGDLVHTEDGIERTGYSASMDLTVSVDEQHPVRPSAARCLRYSVTIPWNGVARDSQSGGSDAGFDE